MLNILSQKAKELRKAKGLSQQALADLAGLDRTTVGAFERNDYTDIGIRKVQRIFMLLDQSLTVQTIGLPTLDDLNAVNHQESGVNKDN
ncbi:MAG: helix-turn-helix transcriptional regulator [Saccharospirillaceae bacterium]|nr:helix-turn-helix transcriptional regulator [Pseudomonadales bacterium]NRB79757.1 helix-turn-helix transcriptional regulator [Saccharospirillaceae bacterium]